MSASLAYATFEKVTLLSRFCAKARIRNRYARNPGTTADGNGDDHPDTVAGWLHLSRLVYPLPVSKTVTIKPHRVAVPVKVTFTAPTTGLAAGKYHTLVNVDLVVCW